MSASRDGGPDSPATTSLPRREDGTEPGPAGRTPTPPHVAAAPLGTDDEAAGMLPQTGESRTGEAVSPRSAAPPRPVRPAPPRKVWSLRLVAALALLAALTIVVLLR